MTPHIVGHIVEIFRYPVKSMAEERLNSVDVGWNGLTGDRRWAFVRGGFERSGFPWLTIRENPDMWRYRPGFVEPGRPDLSPTLVRTPDGRDLDVIDPRLAAELGHGSRVIRQSRGIFDTMPLSLISTATVSAIASAVNAKLDMRRFRPNFVIEASSDDPFAEDQLVGEILRIGAMKMRVDKRDKRCVMVNVDPDTTARNANVLRVIAQDRDACVGVYGTTVAEGRVAAGDPVVIE